MVTESKPPYAERIHQEAHMEKNQVLGAINSKTEASEDVESNKGWPSCLQRAPTMGVFSR